MTHPWQLSGLARRGSRLVGLGSVLGLVILLAVTGQWLRAAEPLKVAGLPVT